MSRSSGVRGAMYLFMTGVIFITVLGNLVLSWKSSISYFKQLHSPTNFLILSMAIIDFLLGFTIMPYSRDGMIISVENCWYFGITFCKVHYSFNLMLCLVSIFHLCSIAVDHLYAICYPLHYSSKITFHVIRQLLAICWTVPAAFAFGIVFSEAYASGIQGYKILVACSSLCPIVFNKLWGTVLFTVGLFAPSCVMIGIYAIFFVISKKHARVVNNMPDDANNDVRSQLSKKKDREAAMTLSIFMGMFLICWFPCFFTFLIDPFLHFTTTLVLFDALNWFGYFNSTCNPLIYDFFIHDFRKH
ncbi:trace amine-associated receptor 2-like [Malaclemys terrapin pileata]|uniref:trace amine-associated receptor 2-like n=1 Tax=Malaclemys terrapin pileata TaxID=2991368 RepID=UPI0023A815FF|nr:trace amine-associated receptor 2-like [Malaclemys terrapin pileata]